MAYETKTVSCPHCPRTASQTLVSFNAGHCPSCGETVTSNQPDPDQ